MRNKWHWLLFGRLVWSQWLSLPGYSRSCSRYPFDEGGKGRLRRPRPCSSGFHVGGIGPPHTPRATIKALPTPHRPPSPLRAVMGLVFGLCVIASLHQFRPPRCISHLVAKGDQLRSQLVGAFPIASCSRLVTRTHQRHCLLGNHFGLIGFNRIKA